MLAILICGCAPQLRAGDNGGRHDDSCVECDGDDNVPFWTDDDWSRLPNGDEGQKEWTVMVYFATHVGDADKLASAVRENLRAMRGAGAGSYANVIIQYHRPETGRVAGVEDVRFELPADGAQVDDPLDGVNIVQTLGDTDSGNPQTLTDFVSWAMQTYPAHRYALILHGHGLAWQGFGFDANHNNHKMKLGEIRGALAQALGGARLDLLMFDGCLMATLEVAAEMQPIARYLLASETVEVAAGQPYGDVLPLLTTHPTVDTDHMMANLAHAYVLYYSATHGYSGPTPPTALTEVGLDLDRIDALSDKMRAVGDALRRRPAGGLLSGEVAKILADKEMAIADDGIHSSDLVQVLSGLEWSSITDDATKAAAHDAQTFIAYPDDGYNAAERSVVVKSDAADRVIFGLDGWTRNDDVTGQSMGLVDYSGGKFPSVTLLADPGAPSQFTYVFRPWIPNALEFDWVLRDEPHSVRHERDYYITQSFRSRNPDSPFVVEAHTQGYYLQQSEMVHGLGLFFGTVLPTFTEYRGYRFASQSGWPCVFRTLASCPAP
jgi:hypothetical protein